MFENFQKQITESKSEKTQLIVVFGCGSCLLQCLFSSLIIGLFWWNNRTWLNFLKLQCCAAIIAAMGMFIYAVNNNIPEVNSSLYSLIFFKFVIVSWIINKKKFDDSLKDWIIIRNIQRFIKILNNWLKYWIDKNIELIKILINIWLESEFSFSKILTNCGINKLVDYRVPGPLWH